MAVLSRSSSLHLESVIPDILPFRYMCLLCDNLSVCRRQPTWPAAGAQVVRSIPSTASLSLDEFADQLYPFLPDTPYHYADQSISLPGVAAKLGLAQHLSEGSKRPAITSVKGGVKNCPLKRPDAPAAVVLPLAPSALEALLPSLTNQSQPGLLTKRG